MGRAIRNLDIFGAVDVRTGLDGRWRDLGIWVHKLH